VAIVTGAEELTVGDNKERRPTSLVGTEPTPTSLVGTMPSPSKGERTAPYTHGNCDRAVLIGA
jgi:hypothetical protein